MRFIDKTNLSSEQDLIDGFMDGHWVESEGYSNINYEELEPNRKTELNNLCKCEQQYFCCYCMRDLRDDSEDSSLEHIIPRSVKGVSAEDLENAEFDRYMNSGVDSLNRSTVILSSKFDKTVRGQRPKYPHDIAPCNLVVSCEGKYGESNTQKTCNHKRGSKYIYPFFYDRSVQQNIEYWPKGIIRVSNRYKGINGNETPETIIVSANLLDSNLVAIRRLWYLCRHCPIQTIESLLIEDRIAFVKTLPEYENVIDADSMDIAVRPTKWDTFLKYHWFHAYYSQRYP